MDEHESVVSLHKQQDRVKQASVSASTVRRERRNQVLGRLGENLAVGYLEARQYKILGRNWRCRHGEIDIIARHDDLLAFIEVKTRSSNNFGHPFEAITMMKLSRMHSLARLWCAEHPDEKARVRLDVIGILAPRGVKPQIEHLQGVHA